MGMASRKIVEERLSVQQYLSRLYQVYGVDVANNTAAVGASA